MKALVATGKPDALVALADVDQPAPQPDEVLVEVQAFSVNRGETFLLEDPPAGWRPGKDVAGTVVEAAADGYGPAEGTRIVGHPPAAGWAEYAAVAVSSLAELPPEISAVTAAALPLAGLTALRLLRAAGNVTGQRILLTGASGGVGHYVTELAANAGADVTVITATPERSSRLRELGATAVAHEVTDAQGPFDLVLESAGGASLTHALDLLRPGGTLIWFGEASREPVTVDFFRLLYGATSATIRHFSYADFAEPYGPDLSVLVRLVASGKLHPEVGHVGDWADTAATITDLRERRIRGNAVLTIQ
jgi:NADPH:quinone reductase